MSWQRALADEPPMRGGSDEVFAAAGALRRRRRVLTAVSGLATVAVLAGAFLGVSALAHPGTRSDVTQPAAPPAVVTAEPSTTRLCAQRPARQVVRPNDAGCMPQRARYSQVRNHRRTERRRSSPTPTRRARPLVMSTVDAGREPALLGRQGTAADTGALERHFQAAPAALSHCTPREHHLRPRRSLSDGAKTITMAGPNRR